MEKERDSLLIGFWVSGGRIGLGHVMRSLAIASHLRSNSNARVVFQSSPDSVVHQLIKAKGFTLEEVGRNISTEAEPSSYTEIDAWIIDVHDRGPDIVSGLRRRWPQTQMVALDYFDYESECPNTIINLSYPDPNHRMPPDWVEYHEGLDYAIIRDEFKPYRDLPKRDGSVGNILVCFGSSDVGRSTQMVVEAAVLAAIPGATYHVVLGPNVSHRDKLLQNLAANTLNAQVYDAPPNLPALMADSDLAIAGGGTTWLELAYLGVPTVAIGQTEREDYFAGLLEDRGVLIRAGMADTCRAPDLANLLADLVSQTERLTAMQRNAKRVVDGQGIGRITDILIRQVKRG